MAAPRSPSRTWASSTTSGSTARRPSDSRSRTSSLRKPPERFWALRHVNVELNHGESLAVIGPNGAGKSTFLQVLAGIMRPTEGSVVVRGQVSGLLGLGVGFDVELSGVENILLGGAFLGLDGPRIRALLPSIVEFADLGPVHRGAAQDLLVRHARATRLRDRDRGRSGHPPPRRGARHRRRELPGQVEGPRHRAGSRGQGRRPRDPRHGLGARVLQSGAARWRRGR